MGDEVRSTPGKSEVGKVGNVRENDAQNHPHHHLPSRREVGGGERGRALASGVGKVELLSGLGSKAIRLPEQGRQKLTPSHELQPCRMGACEGLTLGIDLGAAGAVSVLDADGHLLDVRDLPCLDDGPRARPTVSASGFAMIVREWQPERAVVEFVASRPTDSPMSAFAFGMARATVMSTLEVLGVSATFISVPVWKRAVGIGAGKGQKSTARAEATRRWPQFAESFARARDDGRSESALIGLAGIMRNRAGK